jgi:PCFT/HCP family folate transporter-like MFS transporter 1/3
MNLASFSDVYGRKSFFLAPLIGTFLKNTLCAIGIYFNFNIAYFIIFYAVEGCTGTWVSTLSMVYCYIADLTEPGKPRTIDADA